MQCVLKVSLSINHVQLPINHTQSLTWGHSQLQGGVTPIDPTVTAATVLVNPYTKEGANCPFRHARPQLQYLWKSFSQTSFHHSKVAWGSGHRTNPATAATEGARAAEEKRQRHKHAHG